MIRLVTLLVLLLCASLCAPAQSAPPAPKGFPAPHNGPKKKKDTSKPNPYLVDTLLHPIPFNRLYIHDKISKELEKADLKDGKLDSAIFVATDTAMGRDWSNILFRGARHSEIFMENLPPACGRDSISQVQEKIRALNALWEILRQYNGEAKPDLPYYMARLESFDSMVRFRNERRLQDYVRRHIDYPTLDNGKNLFENQGDARTYLYLALGLQNPGVMIRRLTDFATDSFAGAIIAADARLEPELIFNYASSTNPLIKNAIGGCTDTLTQRIVEIARHSKAPLKALAFLDDLYRGRLTLTEIDSITSNNDLLFQNLVRLKMTNGYLARYSYCRDLNYRAIQYVRKINDLHEEHDEIRFKCIDSLKALDLYEILVEGQDEIYTSSYLGIFKRMMARLAPAPGNHLLDTLGYDQFRTFIRLCANYNTLSDFLLSMPDTARFAVMDRFIGGLKDGKNDELEDAVNVADALGSIKDSTLSAYLDSRIKANYEQSYQEHSKKGMIVYSLLAKLQSSRNISSTDTGASVASKRLHLPPINKIPFKEIATDSGTVYQQVFFFGDEDGEKSYRGFMEGFTDNTVWHTDTTGRFWTTIAATNKRTVIYANKPLAAPDDEDAQNRLCRYLADSGIHPTVVIHRGHSYHLPLTLAKLDKYARVVILGSCGGYHNLSLVLDKAPEAHIVSSKQTGSMGVNDPIIGAFNKRLLTGADIDWIAIWNELDEYFASKPGLLEKFSDYVPPHKNLGAIFIRAYRNMMKI